MTANARTSGLLAVLLTCQLSLVGCATNHSRADYFRPEPIAGSVGVIYVYRLDGSSALPIEVVVDSISRGFIDKGEYLPITVEPGEHFIRTQARTSVVRRIVTAPGESRYLEATMHGWDKRIRLDVPTLELGRERIARARRASEP